MGKPGRGLCFADRTQFAGAQRGCAEAPHRPSADRSLCSRARSLTVAPLPLLWDGLRRLTKWGRSTALRSFRSRARPEALFPVVLVR